MELFTIQYTTVKDMGQSAELSSVSMNAVLADPTLINPPNLLYKHDFSFNNLHIPNVGNKALVEHLPAKRPKRDEPNKRFKCDYIGCGKAFSKSDHLKTHFRTHTGERPYKCTTCEKGFSDLANLKRHIRIHTGVKPFKCYVCEKSFAVSSNLKQHRRTHTGDRPYECPICRKTFSHVSSRRKHCMAQHDGDVICKSEKSTTQQSPSTSLGVAGCPETIPSVNKGDFLYNPPAAYSYPDRNFFQQIAVSVNQMSVTTRSFAPGPQPASTTTRGFVPGPQPAITTTRGFVPGPQPAITTTRGFVPGPQPASTITRSYMPTMISPFTTTAGSYSVYSSPFYSGPPPCQHASYTPAAAQQITSHSFGSPEPREPVYEGSPISCYNSYSPEHQDTVYQIDGNFDISPPNSIDSAVSLEELYSFFDCSVLQPKTVIEEELSFPQGNLNQSLNDNAKKELDVEPVRIKQEIVEDSEEMIIERIKQDLLRSLLNAG